MGSKAKAAAGQKIAQLSKWWRLMNKSGELGSEIWRWKREWGSISTKMTGFWAVPVQKHMKARVDG